MWRRRRRDDYGTRLEEVVSRSGRGDILAVLAWIGTNHLNRDMLREVQAGVGDAAIHVEPLPDALHMIAPVLPSGGVDLGPFTPSAAARHEGAAHETVLAKMELDSQAVQGQVALHLLKFC